MPKCVLLLLLTLCPAGAQAQWANLIGKNLDNWESVGDGRWTLMKDGVILGQRDPRNAVHQAWLYTRQDYGEFDLHVEYWTRLGGNSGISIRDTSRGRHSAGTAHDGERTPSHIGYEIQISMAPGEEKYPSGSLYLFAAAPKGVQTDNDWNALEIESREKLIRIQINGKVTAEHPGDSARSKTGPIGLQLHDQQSVVMFRNIRIHELTKR
jgi:hypothetical protein